MNTMRTYLQNLTARYRRHRFVAELDALPAPQIWPLLSMAILVGQYPRRWWYLDYLASPNIIGA